MAEGTPTETPSTWKDRLAEWLFSQGVSTVLLVAILAAIAYGGHHAMTTAIPKHLEQIQRGYKEVSEDHRQTVKEIVDSNERERKVLHDWLREKRGLTLPGSADDGT